MLFIMQAKPQAQLYWKIIYIMHEKTWIALLAMLSKIMKKQRFSKKNLFCHLNVCNIS